MLYQNAQSYVLADTKVTEPRKFTVMLIPVAVLQAIMFRSRFASRLVFHLCFHPIRAMMCGDVVLASSHAVWARFDISFHIPNKLLHV
jgi:hypothetical protein